MNSEEKKVSYTTSNSYSTLNTLNSDTETIWIVFHGMGYLSTFFINYFKVLDTNTNFIIAPQAPSKYYQDSKFKHVGSSWLTRENTQVETENILTYIDAIAKNEGVANAKNIVVLGYSQGVSIATRWVSSRKIQCKHLVLHSGGIPTELKASDFSFLNKNIPVTYLYGNKDQYITEARKTEQLLLGNNLFGERLRVHKFEGIHEVNTNFIKNMQ